MFLGWMLLGVTVLLPAARAQSQQEAQHEPQSSGVQQNAVVKPAAEATAAEAANAEVANNEAAGEHGATGEAEEADEHAAFKHSPSVQRIARMLGMPVESAYWFALGVNFALIAGLVVWAWRGNAPQAFRERTASIQKGMEEARRSTEEASRRLSEVESRLSRLDGEISSIRKTAEEEAAKEEERIRSAAEQDKQKLVEAARQEIEAISRQARRDLKAHAAELAVSLAEQRIRVDEAADHAIVGNFVRQLANGNERV